MPATIPVHTEDIFTISRTFECPVGVMFEMWTKPEHMLQWMAPAGFQMELYLSDIRTGGKTFYRMWGAGIEFFGRSEFLKLESPNLIVYRQQFCDKDENLSRHPLAPIWPETMQTRVDFVSEDESHTRLTVRSEPIGAVDDEELAAFIAELSGMTQGWTGSFNKLEKYASQITDMRRAP